jgi:hypothetical protein
MSIRREAAAVPAVFRPRMDFPRNKKPGERDGYPLADWEEMEERRFFSERDN